MVFQSVSGPFLTLPVRSGPFLSSGVNLVTLCNFGQRLKEWAKHHFDFCNQINYLMSLQKKLNNYIIILVTGVVLCPFFNVGQSYPKWPNLPRMTVVNDIE